jgi:hypothetical protein
MDKKISISTNQRPDSSKEIQEAGVKMGFSLLHKFSPPG